MDEEHELLITFHGLRPERRAMVLRLALEFAHRESRYEKTDEEMR